MGWETSASDSSPTVQVASHSLFKHMEEAGADGLYVVLREGKWDIPSYWGDGRRIGVPIAYLMVHSSRGVPFTLDQGYPFVEEATVLFGFPDIVIQSDDSVFSPLLRRLDVTGADVVLGLCATSRPETADMVQVGPEGRAVRIVVKPQATSLTHAWICAVWTPTFTRFLHEFVGDEKAAGTPESPELHLGHVLQSGIEAGLHVEALRLPAVYTDIGTPEVLREEFDRKR